MIRNIPFKCVRCNKEITLIRFFNNEWYCGECAVIDGFIEKTIKEKFKKIGPLDKYF